MRNVLIILFFLLFTSCGTSKYNKIEFIDSFNEVQGKMVELASLLKYGNHKCKTDYSINFEFDTIKVTNHMNDKEFVKNYFCTPANISDEKIKEIVQILKRNNLTYMYKHNNTGIIMFGYLDYNMLDGSSLREIALNDVSANISTLEILKADRNIIEIKGKLILTSLKR